MKSWVVLSLTSQYSPAMSRRELWGNGRSLRRVLKDRVVSRVMAGVGENQDM
jgi:hypothetical protein